MGKSLQYAVWGRAKRAREGENQSSNVVDPEVDQDHNGTGAVLEGNQSLCCKLTSS